MEEYGCFWNTVMVRNKERCEYCRYYHQETDYNDCRDCEQYIDVRFIDEFLRKFMK